MQRPLNLICLPPVSALFCFAILLLIPHTGYTQWKMHTVDDSSRGADGVRLLDVNGDSRLDIVTAWEEGGLIRVYLNPGKGRSKEPWPKVDVGRVRSPEDAVFVDVDGDGAVDVVSCCEGKNRCVYVHWAPSQNYLDSRKWRTMSIPCTKGKAWMFAVPSQIDGENGKDLFIGSKSSNAQVSWLQSPKNPRIGSEWKLHRIVDAGWIMSLRLVSISGSRVPGLLVSDRKGKKRGVYFLTPKQDTTVPPHPLPAWSRIDLWKNKHEYMFLDFKPAKKSETDSMGTVATATRNGMILKSELDSKFQKSSESSISNPLGVLHGKAIAIGDIDLDGKDDLVHTTNTQSIKRRPLPSGVTWMRKSNNGYRSFPISTNKGRKFDRIELIDLDDDGDLDVLTCEEASNLGVIWFENPTR